MNLLGAMHREYSRSKRWSLMSVGLTVLFSICSFAGSLGPSQRARWIAVVAFVTQVSIVECRRRSGVHYRLSEVVRRPAVLLAGLARQPSQTEIRRIALRLGVSDADDRIEPETYYATKAPPGALRLIEIVEESSFWTADLAEQTASFLGGAFVLTIILSIVALYAAVEAGWTTNYSEAAGKILLAFATFYFTGDVVQLKSKYRELAQAAARVTDQCTILKSKPEAELLREAMLVTDDYNCALAVAPIVPEIIYRFRRERLNAAWAEKWDSSRSV